MGELIRLLAEDEVPGHIHTVNHALSMQLAAAFAVGLMFAAAVLLVLCRKR